MENLKFAGKKWDARNWTREQKIQWQKKAFDLGYSWLEGKNLKFLEKDLFVTDFGGTLLYTYNGYSTSSYGELLNFEDMFPEEEEKLDVIKEITKLFSESFLEEAEEDISEEAECGFEGLVYVEPDFKGTYTYFCILRKNCTEPQWRYLLSNLDLLEGEAFGKEDSLQNCGDGDGWFDCDFPDEDDVVISFNDLFKYKEDLCSVQ